MFHFGLSKDEIIKRTLKYFLVFVTIALALKYVPSVALSWNDIFIVSTITVCSMVALELYCPTLKINKPIDQNEELYE